MTKKKKLDFIDQFLEKKEPPAEYALFKSPGDLVTLRHKIQNYKKVE